MTIKQKSAITLLTTSVLCFLMGYANAHSGPLNELAIKACAIKEKSQMCRYEGGHNDLYIGTCQYMADQLMCVRNQPIKFIEQNKEKNKLKHEHTDNQYGFN